jgi:hypothetical protein
MEILPLGIVLLGLLIVTVIFAFAPKPLPYPSEEWCNTFYPAPDAVIYSQHFPGDDYNFCEFNHTDNQWHINKTELRAWQFRAKFGVDP